jgi:hypothetical protein
MSFFTRPFLKEQGRIIKGKGVLIIQPDYANESNNGSF